MNTRHILLCLALSLLGAGLQAQTDLPQVFSPNAAELGKYGKIPVSYFNGLPNITIPLTELKAKNYTLPIYLTYHAGGNKPDQHPGWVGLGWTLHAGGCINRIVNVKKDEMSRVESIGITGDGIGHLYHSNEMSTHAGRDSIMNRIVYNWDDDDYAPDEFVINTDDIQASFYIVGEDDIRIVSKSNADFTVQFELETEPSNYPGLIIAEGYDGLGQYRSNKANRYTYFKRFVVTGKDGTRYIFGGDDSAIEFSTTVKSFATVDEYNRHWAAVATANTWYLKRIEHPDGEVVSFDYVKEGKPMVLIDRHHGEYFHPLDEDVAARIGYYDESTYRGDRYNSRYHVIFLQPSYLSTIRSKQTGETITFDRERSYELGYEITEDQFIQAVGDFSTDGNTLGNLTFPVMQENDYYMRLIKIRSSARPEVNIRFHHKDSTARRLTLQQIDFVSSSPDHAYIYAFNYNETDLLPPYNSKQTDYWGYYNGRSFKGINGSTYSQIDVLRSHVDPLKMQAEILTSISYPTGGRSEFMYEPHDYRKVVHRYPFYLEEMGMDKKAGGLRIRSIIDYPAEGKAETRTFIYKDGNRSSGILSGQPQNSDGDNHYEMPSYFVNANGTKIKYEGTFPVSYKIYSEDAVNELSTTEGNHVTYSKVQEQRGDGSIVEYEYSNHDSEEGMDTFPSFYDKNYGTKVLSDKANSRELFRGLLIKKTGRNSNGDMCFTEENEYKIDTLSSIHSIEWKTYFGQRLYSLRHGTIFCGHPYLQYRNVTQYADDGTSQQESSQYTYDSHRNLTSETRTSGDQTVRDDYTYPGNYPDIPVYADMSTSGRHALPVEHVRSVDGAVSEAELVTWKQAGAPGDYVPSERFKATPTGLPDFTVLYDGITVNDAYGPPLVRYLDYDAHSNLTQSATPDGTHTSYTWDRDSTHLRGVFVGAERKERSRIWSEQARVTEEEDLSDLHDRFYGNSFTTVADGPVTVNIWFDAGDERDIWGRFDGDSLLSFHCPVPTSTGGLTPIYTCTFQLPAGQHSLSLSTREGVFLPVIPVLHSPGATGVVGDHPGHDPLDPVVIIDPNGKPLWGYLSLTYWGDADYVRVRDEAECAHFSFEDTGDTADGFQSAKSQTAQTTVHLVLNPDRTYTMDRRVKRNGEWVYERMPFGVNTTDTYTLHADGAPFDEVRIYADGVQPETCTWWPDGNLRSRTDARGVTESYVYDGLGRLTGVYDNEGKKVAEYTYNYQNR